MARAAEPKAARKASFEGATTWAAISRGAEPDHDPERRLNLAQQKSQAHIVGCQPVEEAVQPPEQHPGGRNQSQREQDLG